MASMRVLVTGFGPFPGVPVNPTDAAVQALRRRAPEDLPGLDLITAILPVDLALIPGLVGDLIAQHEPELVVCTGVASGSRVIRVERVAVNLVDARVPDANGFQPIDIPVVAGAPDGLLATLPVKAIHAAITALGLPAEVSLSAGTYGCNAAMFAALHGAAPGVRAGFLHIPDADVLDADAVASALAATVRACLEHDEDLAVHGGAIA